MKKNLFVLRLLALVAIPIYFASCSESGDDNGSTTPPDTPSNPDVTQVIPTTGGNISYENVSATFTSGTFSNASEVSITEEKIGAILGEDEQSKFYQITIPLDIKKEFTVSIKSEKKDENTVFIFHAPVVATHNANGTVTYADIIMPARYANGAYTAQIPSAYNSGVKKDISMSFGLAKALSSNSQGRRSASNGDIKWKINWFGWSWIVTNRATMDKIESDINAAMNEAVKVIKDLGFKVKGDRNIPINMCSTGLKDGEYGAHCQSCISDSNSVINLNRSLLTGNKYNAKILKRTIMHELFHYFQSAYDPSGTAWEKCSVKEQPERLRIMEAGGVWIEKQADESRMYDAGWVVDFQRALRGYLDEGAGGDEQYESAFQTWGYGSAPVLDWFELKKGKEQIVKMYETWRDKKTNPFNSWLIECEKACGVEFFNKFSDYITTMAEGNLNAGIDWTNINTTTGKRKFTAANFETKENIYLNANQKETRRDVVYRYGIKTLRVTINKDLDVKGQQLKIYHQQQNILAKVWKVTKTTGEASLIGTVTAGKPLQITNESTLGSLRNTHVLMVVLEQISNARQQEAYEITASLEEPEISTSPKTLAFEAKGGTKEVTVVTNQPNFKVKANNDWLEVRKVDNLTFKVTANQNTGNARTGSVTVTALNEENKEVGTYEMQVTQEEREKGAFDFTDLKYITIEVNTKVHYTGVWDGDQNDVFVLTKFPDNFNITPAYLAESPSTQTTVTPVGNGVHIECICQTEESGEWMGVWNITRDYQVTLDIDDVVSGKITNISAKCYWYNIHRADASVGGNVEESHNDEKLSASNIPLPDKSGVAKGDQWTNTSINCSRSEHRGWTDYKYTTISSDEYSIVVNFHK